MSAEIIELDVITKLDLNASEILREIAERFKHFIFSEDCDDAEGGAA
jgi:hypothetical protein